MLCLPFPWFKSLRFREEGRRAVTKQGFLPMLPVLGLCSSRAELLNMAMVNDDCSSRGCCLGQGKDIREEEKTSVVCVGWSLRGEKWLLL